MRLFLLLALLSLVAAAPLTTCKDAVDSATQGLEPTAQPATVEETESQEEENDEEKFEIEKENAFESFRTIHRAEGGSRTNTSTMDEKFEKHGDSAGVKTSSPKEANEKHKVRRRSPTEEKCSSQTEVESGSAEDAKDKSLEKASEASKETKEKTKESKEQQRRRRSPAKKEDSDDTVKETTKFASGATESTPLENKEKHDGERTRRVLEGQETSFRRTRDEFFRNLNGTGSAKKGSRGQVKPPPGDGHIVREKPVAEDMSVDDTARGTMATGHMAAIHTLETIGKRMQEKSSN